MQISFAQRYAPRPLALPVASNSTAPTGFLTIRRRPRLSPEVRHETQVRRGVWRDRMLDIGIRVSEIVSPGQLSNPDTQYCYFAAACSSSARAGLVSVTRA
jgi:hypothetical protein